MINFFKKVIKEDIDDLDAQFYVPPEVQQSLDALKVLYENRKQK